MSEQDAAQLETWLRALLAASDGIGCDLYPARKAASTTVEAFDDTRAKVRKYLRLRKAARRATPDAKGGGKP